MNLNDDRNDVMGIIYWKEDDGRHYRIRGWGPTYNSFYDWANACDYCKFTSNDWPWDYFIVTKLSAEKEMWDKFGEYIEKDQD